MRFCPSCDRHLFEGTITCPFCLASCGTIRSGSLAILGITLGVALTACGEPKPGGTADENTTASTPNTDGNTTVDTDDPEDSFDAYGATYTVSGDSPWSAAQTASTLASTETDPHTATGTATDTDTDTGTDTSTTGTDTGTTGTDTGTSSTTGTDTGTSTTTTTDTGSTGTASSTG